MMSSGFDSIKKGLGEALAFSKGKKENTVELTWQTNLTREGIKAADEGRFVSDAEMERIFNKYTDSNASTIP